MVLPPGVPFHRNAQPFYVMIDHDGEHIGGSAGYDPDADVFIDFSKTDWPNSTVDCGGSIANCPSLRTGMTRSFDP